MVKFITKSVCAALLVLCVMSLNAQVSSVPSAGHVPYQLIQANADVATQSAEFVPLISSRGNIARGQVSYGGPKYIEFDSDNIMSHTTITTTFDCYGGGYLEGNLYSYRNDKDGSGNALACHFQVSNSETGALISSVERSELYGVVVGSVCYDYSTNTMYAVRAATGASTLSTVDLATGALTQVAMLSGLTGIPLAFAITLEGNMYVIESAPAGNGILYSVSPTGVCTPIGSGTGFAVNYAQSMAFDYNDPDQPLYWAQIAQPSGIVSTWAKVDITTGLATAINTSIGMEITALHFPYGGDPGNDCPVVTNVTAVQFKGTQAKISWTAPSVTDGLTGYKIYDGATEIGSVAVGVTTFVTGNLTSGEHTFAVEANYDNGCTPKKVTAALTIKTCGNAIENVDVQYDADCKATVTWDAVAKGRSTVVYDNGPFITHPGQGAGGADVSAINEDYSSLYGLNAGQANNYQVADDFTLTSGVAIETMDFWTYQTSAPAGNSPITAVYVRIFDGSPMSGGNVIWGDLTTNRLLSTSYSNVNRISIGSDGYTGTARRIWLVTADLGGLELAAGTYWVAWTYVGSSSYSGPWQLPVSIMGDPQTTGNAIFNNGSTWASWSDDYFPSAKYEIPFVIYGEGGEPPEPKYNVYMGDELVAEGIEATTYTHNVAVEQGEDVEWCVTQVCPGGGESEAGCKTAKCGEAPPPPCNPATELTIDFTADACAPATLKWTAAADMPDAKYRVYRDDDQIANDIAETEYVDATFELDVEHTWTVKTICTDGEAEGVSVTESCGVGINELSNSVSIYPNPVSGMVTIKVEGFAKVEVYNTVGQLVETRTIPTFDVSSYNTGIYLFKVYDVYNNSVTKRVMVK